MTQDRTRNSARARRVCFEAHRHDGPLGKGRYLTCHKCKCEIDVVKTPSGWRADHNVHWANGGEDTAENLWPICLGCDAGVGGKAADDTTKIAKGKRQSANHFGLAEKRGPAMPGTKRSGWKRKINGETVRR